ncbi:hypothetical protein ACHQM5_027279 [Ranunculus cassubicifolius]
MKHLEGPWKKIEYAEDIRKVLDMYEGDPDFRSLHGEIANLFAESLKFDIQNFLEKEHAYDRDKDQPLELTEAANYCEASPFLLESVAKRVFPHVVEVEAAVELLRNEVLDPLKKVLSEDLGDDTVEANIFGYIYEGLGSEPKDLKKSLDKMVADAILPNELVECVIAGDVSVESIAGWAGLVPPRAGPPPP